MSLWVRHQALEKNSILLIIGIAVFLAALILATLRMRRRPGRRPTR